MSTNTWNSGFLYCLAFEKVAHYKDEELNLDYLQVVLLRRLLYDHAILNFNLQYYSEDPFTNQGRITILITLVTR